jgi:conjugal transfer pilus assembly protein TraB
VTNPTATPATSVRRRQYLLLGGIAAIVLGATFMGVALTSSKQDTTPTEKPRTTNILAPGAQVDPKDAWRGQADAQMKAIEQKSLEVAQKNSELTRQNKEMLERLKKLEQSALTPLPPAPVPAPPVRPDFGPDALGKSNPNSTTGPQMLSPTPAPKGTPTSMPPGKPPAPAVTNPGALAPSQPAIISVSLGDGPKLAKEPSAESKKPAKNAGAYMPSGSFTRAVLLGGLDAPTGGQAQRNPQPVLLRLTDNAILPNHFRFRVKECFVVGAGYGDISSERAYIRTEALSCVTNDGQAIDVPIKGYVAGEDGKAGMRGRLVSKQGQLLANALVAGVASGIGQAFQQSATTFSVSPLGTTSTVNQGEQLTAGLGTGVGKALDRLAQYYITLAEKVFPIIEIDAGRTVDVVVTKGSTIEGLDSVGTAGDGSLGALAARDRLLNRRINDGD